jgi:hypothetical protein
MSTAVAVSDAKGTTLPRRGFFPGVHVPHYGGTIINGGLTSAASSNETSIHGWPEPYKHQITQTSTPLPHIPQFPAEAWLWLPTESSIVRHTDAAYAFVQGWNDPTDSPWREHRRKIAPLQSATEAILKDISDALDYDREISVRAKHAGLAAVARLADMLDLTRPTILRMGGVPQSTFYAWRNNPRSVIRTPTVARLLKLQAQVAILDEALGRDRMRAWVFSAGRVDKLQGDEATFTQVLAEAQTVLAEATRIRPRPRMRAADYTSATGGTEGTSASDSSSWPGASKVSDDDMNRT